ncbi:MAG TPA: DMT family transporter [Candidatus Lustribacter sp.]|nr:DMT family transporter [Candidatus Lustribacter sp.]
MRNSTALRTTFAVLAIFTAAVFWGGNAIASKILYESAHFDAPSLFVARAAWSLPLFLLMALLARPQRPPTRAEWGLLAGIGVAFGPGACGLLALAAQYTSGTHVVLLMSLSPPVTAVMAALLLRERVDAIRIVALAIGIGGAALLTLTHSASGSTVFGDLLELGQVLSFATMFVLTRALGSRFSAIFVSGTYGAIGMALLALFGLATGRFGASIELTLAPNIATLWWFFGEIVIGLSIYGQWAQAFALQHLSAGTTSILSSYGTLVVGVIGAVLLLHERIAPIGYVAGLMLAVALALALVPVKAKAF